MSEVTKTRHWRRVAPILALALALLAAAMLRLDRYVSLDALREQGLALDLFVSRHVIAALALYAAIYIAIVSISLPLSIPLSLAGGYLFGPWFGGGAAWLSGATGATVIFLAARSALGDALRRGFGAWIARFEAGFREHAFSYLLALRLTPLIPFWIVNLAPACFNVRPRDFVVATLIGHAPVTFVIASVGAAAHEALRAGTTLDPQAALNTLLTSPIVTGAIAGMVGLALAPVAIKALRRGRD